MRRLTMQRDMKIGMAMGLALVGLVAALFFRHDNRAAESSTPVLESANELDREIAEKPRGPYLKGLEESVEGPSSGNLGQPKSVAGSKGALGKGDPASREPAAREAPYEVSGFLTQEDAAEHRNLLSEKKRAIPNPIASQSPERGSDEPGRFTTSAEPAPAHNQDWQPGSPGENPENSRSRNRGSEKKSAAQITHITQPGETLSGLAAKYLGSSARYREIYEANRSVLKTPDVLPDGVTLVIPAERAKPSTRGTASDRNPSPARMTPASRTKRTVVVEPEEELAAEEPATTGSEKAARESTPPAPPTIRFAPVKRGPFSAGRSEGKMKDD
jgi:nucleoid-associated protein YgaU